MVADTLSIHDLKKDHWKVLKKLENEECIQIVLARFIDIDTADVSKVVCAPLERWGFITREKVGAAKRCKLTTTGQRALTLAREIEQLYERETEPEAIDTGLLGKYIGEITTQTNPKIGYRAAEDLIEKAPCIGDISPIEMVYQALVGTGCTGDARIRLLELLSMLLQRGKEEGLFNVRNRELKDNILKMLCQILGTGRLDTKQDVCLFDLKKIPGEHNQRLLAFLHDVGRDFEETVEILPSEPTYGEDGTTVAIEEFVVKDVDHHVRLYYMLDTNILWFLNNGDRFELLVREEGDNLNVYPNWVRPKEMSAAYDSMKLICEDYCYPCMLGLCLQAMKPPADRYLPYMARSIIDRIAGDAMCKDPILKERYRDTLLRYKQEFEEDVKRRFTGLVNLEGPGFIYLVNTNSYIKMLDETLISLPHKYP